MKIEKRIISMLVLFVLIWVPILKTVARNDLKNIKAGPQPTSGVNLHEGLWEITTKMQMPGMQMPARKHTQCLTKKNMLKNMVPKEQSQEEECKITDTKINGSTVTWVMKCNGEDAMKVIGKITYFGDTFEGTITMILSDPEEGETKMINHISGKRIGACK